MEQKPATRPFVWTSLPLYNDNKGLFYSILVCYWTAAFGWMYSNPNYALRSTVWASLSSGDGGPACISAPHLEQHHVRSRPSVQLSGVVGFLYCSQCDNLTDRLNTLRCVTSCNPITCSSCLLWTEYAYKLQVSAAKGIVSFQGLAVVPTATVRPPGGRGRCPVCPCALSSLQADLETGACHSITLFFPGPETGGLLQSASTDVSAGAEGLSVLQGPSVGDRIPKAGPTVRGPF